MRYSRVYLDGCRTIACQNEAWPGTLRSQHSYHLAEDSAVRCFIDNSRVDRRFLITDEPSASEHTAVVLGFNIYMANKYTVRHA